MGLLDYLAHEIALLIKPHCLDIYDVTCAEAW